MIDSCNILIEANLGHLDYGWLDGGVISVRLDLGVS